VKAAAYFREFVEPAIEEFAAEPTSIRHAYAACLFAYHFADAVHVARREPKDGIRKAIAALAKPEEAFWVVAGIVTLAKHLEVTRLPVKPKLEDLPIGLEAAFSDGTHWSDGTSWSDAEEVVMVRDDQGNLVDVRECLLETYSAIEAYLAGRPELV
jgi:hypothetical protein